MINIRQIKEGKTINTKEIPIIDNANVSSYFKRFRRLPISDMDSPTIRGIFASDPDVDGVTLAELKYFSMNYAGSRNSDEVDSIIEATEICSLQGEYGRTIVWIPYILHPSDSIPKMMIAIMQGDEIINLKMGIPGDTCELNKNRSRFGDIVPELTLGLGKKRRKICGNGCHYRIWDAYPQLNMNVQVAALLTVAFAISPIQYIGVREDAAGVPCRNTALPSEWDLPVSQEMISYKKILDFIRGCKEPDASQCAQRALQNSYYARWGFVPLPHSIGAIAQIGDRLGDPLFNESASGLSEDAQAILMSVGEGCTVGSVLYPPHCRSYTEADGPTQCLMRFTAYNHLEKTAPIRHLVLERSNRSAIQGLLAYATGGKRRFRTRCRRIQKRKYSRRSNN